MILEAHALQRHRLESISPLPLRLHPDLLESVLLGADELAPAASILTQHLLDHHEVAHGLIFELENVLAGNAVDFGALGDAAQGAAVVGSQARFLRLIKCILLANNSTPTVSEKPEGLRQVQGSFLGNLWQHLAYEIHFILLILLLLAHDIDHFLCLF